MLIYSDLRRQNIPYIRWEAQKGFDTSKGYHILTDEKIQLWKRDDSKTYAEYFRKNGTTTAMKVLTAMVKSFRKSDYSVRLYGYLEPLKEKAEVWREAFPDMEDDYA